jgi:hypothetical protein
VACEILAYAEGPCAFRGVGSLFQLPVMLEVPSCSLNFPSPQSCGSSGMLLQELELPYANTEQTNLNLLVIALEV